MPKEYNYQHIQQVCPECHHTNIVKDPFHHEIYCTHCGLILSDNSISKITRLLEYENNRNKWLNMFWRETNKQIRTGEMRDIYKK